MKSILTLCSLTLLTIGVSAQNRLELTAKMPELANDSIVRLWNPIDKQTDSTYVKNHSFSFSKDMEAGGSIFILQIGNANPEKTGLGMLVYLEPGKINISGGSGKGFKDATFKGDGFVQDWIGMNKYMDDATAAFKDGDDLDARLASAKAAGDADAISTIEPQLARFQQQRSESGKKWMNEHISSGVSAYVLNALLNDLLTREEKLYFLTKFTGNARHNQISRMMLSSLTGVSVDLYGSMAKNFIQPDANGKMVSLADFKGKYVLVDFWASWCTPCREEAPALKAAYQKYKDKNFTVVSISLDEDKTKWLKAIADDQLPWLQLSDLKASKNTAAIDYKVLGIPANFLIDPNGKIVGVGYRQQMLEERLSQLLK